MQYGAAARATGCGTEAHAGRTKTGRRKQDMTFRTRQRGFELRIEKPNSHPCAEDFERHPCAPGSFFGPCWFIIYCKNTQWSCIIFHCWQICHRTIRAVNCFPPPWGTGGIVQDTHIMQHNFILIASHFHSRWTWIGISSCAFSREPGEAGAF